MGGQLTAAAILDSLERADLEFFECSVARKAGVSVANVRVLLQDEGRSGQYALYEKSGLPRNEFAWVQSRVEALYLGETSSIKRRQDKAQNGWEYGLPPSQEWVKLV